MGNKLPRKIEKPWGFELLFAHTPKYAGKVIFVGEGHQLSLQFHEKKDESIYIHEGKILVEIEGSDGHMVSIILQSGQCLRVSPLTKHRIKALENTTLFEVSTSELEDITRLEDNYGRVNK